MQQLLLPMWSASVLVGGVRWLYSSGELVSVKAKGGTIGDFELNTRVKDDKVYCFRAASSALRDEWVAAVESVIGDSGSVLPTCLQCLSACPPVLLLLR